MRNEERNENEWIRKRPRKIPRNLWLLLLFAVASYSNVVCLIDTCVYQLRNSSFLLIFYRSAGRSVGLYMKEGVCRMVYNGFFFFFVKHNNHKNTQKQNRRWIPQKNKNGKIFNFSLHSHSQCMWIVNRVCGLNKGIEFKSISTFHDW